MSTRRASFRVSDLLTLTLCYLWYNPAIHLTFARFFW
jgi:hypothetical protein